MCQIALLLLIFFTSCSRAPLSVHTEYFSRKNLASYKVDTPDPQKEMPIYGQRIHISWSVSSETFQKAPLELVIDVRLKNGDTLKERKELQSSSGSIIFPVVGSDYKEKGGILHYQIMLYSNKELLDRSEHKFWVEDITISGD